jgi:hypothetical protein
VPDRRHLPYGISDEQNNPIFLYTVSEFPECHPENSDLKAQNGGGPSPVHHQGLTRWTHASSARIYIDPRGNAIDTEGRATTKPNLFITQYDYAKQRASLILWNHCLKSCLCSTDSPCRCICIPIFTQDVSITSPQNQVPSSDLRRH